MTRSPRNRFTIARLVLAAALFFALAQGSARAEPLVADLSSHLIRITSSFTGTELLLFGAVEGEGDIVVVIRGPSGEVEVRRKRRTVGLWINRDRQVFDRVPAFYWVGATRPLDTLAPLGVLARHQIGLDNLVFAGDDSLSPEERMAFREALVRRKQKGGLYVGDVQPVGRLGAKLFRATVTFPSNVPTGAYSAEVYLVRGNRVISAQTTPLFVRKGGLGDRIYSFAHRQPAAYGLIAVAAALLAGWLAGVMFRRA